MIPGAADMAVVGEMRIVLAHLAEVFQVEVVHCRTAIDRRGRLEHVLAPFIGDQ